MTFKKFTLGGTIVTPTSKLPIPLMLALLIIKCEGGGSLQLA